MIAICTDDNRDRYLVRGNKLYPIMKDGINELPLVKISKKQAKIELQDYPFYYNVKEKAPPLSECILTEVKMLESDLLGSPF